jgi:selenocysteine-specific elongation factor
VVRLPDHSVSLTETQQIKIENFLKSLEEKPFAPPSDLIPEPDLVGLLTGRKQVVKVAEDVIFSYRAYNEMLNRVIFYLKQKGSISIAEVRDMFKTSRKYALSFMEYLDGIKLTRRIGDRRVLYRESAVKHD